jgi:mRNA interferase MazF
MGQHFIKIQDMFKHGDVVSVNFPFTDISITKKRPALIISNEKVNNTGDYLLIQITSKVKNDGLSLQLHQTDYHQHGLPLKSYVRLHKIFLLNESLIIRKVTSVNRDFLSGLIAKIAELLT